MFRFLLPLVFAVSFGTLWAGETLSVRADSWMPYNGDPASDRPGFSIELLKLIFEPQGVTIDYATMPWNRALDECRAGKYDAAVGATRADGEGFVIPAEPIGISPNVFFVKAGGTWAYTGIASLTGIKVGVIDGYSYEDAFDKYVEENRKDAQKLVVATGDDALDKLTKMLLAGRIDALVENPYVVAEMKELKGQVQAAGELKVGDPAIYIIFSMAKEEQSKRFAGMFDKGIAEFRASGKLKELLTKYGLEDWKK